MKTVTINITGAEGCGKSTVAHIVYKALAEAGIPVDMEMDFKARQHFTPDAVAIEVFVPRKEFVKPELESVAVYDD